MAFPTGWILTRTVSTGRCPAQHRFNATTQTARGFGLGLPDRNKTLDDKRRINVCHWQLPKDWAGIGRQSVYPLVNVFCVLPAGSVRFNIGG